MRSSPRVGSWMKVRENCAKMAETPHGSRQSEQKRRIRIELRLGLTTFLAVAALSGCTAPRAEMMGNLHQTLNPESFYLPNAEASRVVSVATNGVVLANILVQTHRAAVKEGGPKETIERFGEVYAFSPNFFAVHREEPTRIAFWNLQPDDNHDFMLIDPHSQVLMSVLLPPLKETAYVFTFHEEGLFSFICALHPPGMAGQILVLPPRLPAPAQPPKAKLLSSENCGSLLNRRR